jgi:hypothetical protein
MTFLIKPLGYSASNFDAFVKTLQWSVWRPKFICLHNTGVPTLAQWLNPSTPEERRVANQMQYEHLTEKWHSGVHLFITPAAIWNACDLRANGVSVSCWNSLCIGIEMVGNFAAASELGPNDPPADDWNGVLAQKVRDNAVSAMASLHLALGIRPDGYVEGVSGLHFHRECGQDHHACPGAQVDKTDIVVRVLARMQELRAIA